MTLIPARVLSASFKELQALNCSLLKLCMGQSSPIPYGYPGCRSNSMTIFAISSGGTGVNHSSYIMSPLFLAQLAD